MQEKAEALSVEINVSGIVLADITLPDGVTASDVDDIWYNPLSDTLTVCWVDRDTRENTTCDIDAAAGPCLWLADADIEVEVVHAPTPAKENHT